MSDHLQRRHNARRKARRAAKLAATRPSFFSVLLGILGV